MLTSLHVPILLGVGGFLLLASLGKPSTPALRMAVCLAPGVAAVTYLDSRTVPMLDHAFERVEGVLWAWTFYAVETLGLAQFLLFVVSSSRVKDNRPQAARHEA